MKPILNIDEVETQTWEEGPFKSTFGTISRRIGAQRLGYRLVICEPGKTTCPFHNHRVNEEMFFILEGEGKLRFGDQEYPLRAGDVVACPPGGREVAHQMWNTGKTNLKYLALSTNDPHEVCEYPDSNKVGVFVGADPQKPSLRKLYRFETDVNYFDREIT